MRNNRRPIMLTLLALVVAVPVVAIAGPPIEQQGPVSPVTPSGEGFMPGPKTTNVEWEGRRGSFKSPNETVPNHQPEAAGGWASVWLSQTATSKTATEVDVCQGRNAAGKPAYGIAHRVVEPNRHGWACMLPSGKLADIAIGEFEIHKVHQTLNYSFVPAAGLSWEAYDPATHGQNPKAKAGLRALCRKTMGGKPRMGTVTQGKCRIMNASGDAAIDGREDVFGPPKSQYTMKDHAAPFEVAVK